MNSQFYFLLFISAFILEGVLVRALMKILLRRSDMIDGHEIDELEGLRWDRGLLMRIPIDSLATSKPVLSVKVEVNDQKKSRSSVPTDTSTIMLSKERETRYEGDLWTVSCMDRAGKAVHWIGPDGTVLTAETKPYVGDGPEGQTLYFHNVKQDLEGVYSCSNGLGVQKYYLKINAFIVETPPPDISRLWKRIIVAGSNCEEGWRADTRGICRELVY